MVSQNVSYAYENILNKIMVFDHDNYFKYFMFGKYYRFWKQGEGFCMHV
jgi:hypothetical protein